MRRTIEMYHTSLRREVNWRRLIILAVVVVGAAALLAGGFRERTAHAQQQPTPTPTSPPPGAWTKCANEGSACTFGGTQRVRYGANSIYNYGIFTGSVQCSNSVFGDPVFGTAKECYYQTLSPPSGGSPDYTKVDDFLNGQRNLLRDDDFVIGYTATDASGNTRGEVLTARTDDSASTINGIYPAPGPQSYTSKPTEFASGRFFNTGTDSAVQFLYDDDKSSYQLRVFDQIDVYINPEYENQLDFLTAANKYFFVSAVADFNGDGYDDIALGYDQPGRLRILTATDVNDPTAGFKLDAPELSLTFNSAGYSITQLTVGDFDGDGQPDLASFYVTSDLTLYVATYSVDPKTLAISAGNTLELTKVTGYQEIPLMQLAAGQFTGAGHDQLLAAYLFHRDGSDTAKVAVIEFDPASLNPKVVNTWNSGDYGNTRGTEDVALRVKTARFDWSSNIDQATWMISPPGGGARLSVLQIDPATYSVTRPGDTRIQPDGPWHGMDVAIGNFDKKKQSPLDPTQKVRDPNLQVGVMGRDVNSYNGFLNLYDVDPATFQITQVNGVLLSGDYIKARLGADSVVQRFWLLPSDLQGRAYRLGAPTKITIDNATQPTVVVGAPPTHVDFAPPAGQTTPIPLNLSAVPEGFYTAYETEETSSNQSSSTNTTSWSFGAKEKVTAGATIGDPDTEGVNVTDTFTAAQNLKGKAEKEHGIYSSQQFDISQKTGLADQVWYSDTRFNIWVYPVLGKTVCPATKPGCQDSEKVPLTVQFSGPDETSTNSMAGNLIEWYQPPWEYGNVLSYPASYAQLQQIVPDINLLSAGPDQAVSLTTDPSNTTVKTTWATGTTDSQSSSFNQNYSFKNNLSVNGSVGLKPIDSVSFGYDLTVSGSFGFSSLNKASSALGKSTGIGVSKPGTFANPFDYNYSVTPYIFGQTQPGGSVDDIPLSGDVKTFGLLRTASIVNLPNQSWWNQAYAVPDVALNHPNRWQITTPGLTNPIPPNCLATGTGSSQMNCAEIADLLPDNPASSQFHDMRGFFISNANSPGESPQLETAKAGDKLALQTRVYNYSLANMDSSDSVHVRFYGMEWNSATNCPAGPATTAFPYCPARANVTPSFLIGDEVVLGAIPPFSSDPGAPLNWIYASTNFDTTPYANKYLT